MVNTPMLKRLLLLLLLSISFTGMLTACAETDSGIVEGKPKLKNFEINILELNGVANKSTTLDFPLTNIGDADLTFTFGDSADWLEIAPADGTIVPAASKTVTFTATCPPAGSHPQTIVDLKTNDPARPTTNIFVSVKCVADKDETEVPAGKANLGFKVVGVPPAIHSKANKFISVYGPDSALVGSVAEGTLIIETAGDYTIKADEITDSETDTLYKAPAEFKVTVSEANFKANSIPVVTVTYVKQEEPVIMADINITVEGLPNGVNANVEVLDAASAILATLTTTGKYTVRAAGAYKVLPYDVTHNGTLYKASAAVDVTVSQDALENDTIAPVTVTYENPTLVKNNSDAGPGSLRDVLAAAPAGSTITFAPTVELIKLTSAAIELTKNVTIDGGRKVTMDGNELHQIFTINSAIEVTIRGLTFTSAASTTSNGGAISNDKGTLNVQNSLFTDNDSEKNGGAIASKDGVLNILNSTFTNNSAVLGGAIYSDSNDTKILYSTFSVNIATSGGAIAAANAAANTKTVQIGKSIIADNTDTTNSPDLLTTADAKPFVSLGYNLIGNNSGSLGFTNATTHDQVGDAILPIAPRLGGIATNNSTIGTMSVGPGSPAYTQIPAASCADAADQDQRGKARPTHGFCDIGAFERGADAPGGFESFENSAATATYLSASFEGDHDITWNYVQARNSLSAEIADKGLIIRYQTEANGSISAENIPGGIKDFSVKLSKATASAGKRQVELFINNVSVGQSIEFGNASGADPTLHTFNVMGINVAGPFKLEIRHSGGTASSARNLTVDNISWTAFP